ncbi:MAG: type IV secretion system DNA-binding domain-containing protein [Gemmataceae bacterium]|nr:type IV secretion system DNA-binding domain-containing protein [Gemmataceae bacterium]
MDPMDPMPLLYLVALAGAACWAAAIVKALSGLTGAAKAAGADRLLGPTGPNGWNVPLGRWRDPWDYCLGVVIAAIKGAGKTSLIKRMVNYVLKIGDPVWLIDTGDRWAEHLTKTAPAGTPVRRISPFTLGGLGIDFAKFLTTRARILAFAKKVIPENLDKNPFFPSNAQLVVMHAIFLLNRMAPRRWTLRDVIVLSCNRPLFLALRNQPRYRRRVSDPLAPFAGGRSARDVIGTVISHLLPLAIFAAMNQRTPAQVSPLDGLADGGVTVLEWNDEFAPSLEKVYALFVELLAMHRLARPLSNKRIWLLLDELASLAPLDCVDKLGQRARRSGVCFLFSLHTVPALWERYGKDRANNILGLMGIKLFLRTSDDSDTLQWAAGCVGKVRTVVSVWQPGAGTQSGQYSRSARDEYLVEPAALKENPLPHDGKVTGYLADDLGPRPFETDYSADCPRPAGPPPEDVPDESQELEPFTVEDVVRLNGPVLPAGIHDALDEQL